MAKSTPSQGGHVHVAHVVDLVDVPEFYHRFTAGSFGFHAYLTSPSVIRLMSASSLKASYELLTMLSPGSSPSLTSTLFPVHQPEQDVGANGPVAIHQIDKAFAAGA